MNGIRVRMDDGGRDVSFRFATAQGVSAEHDHVTDVDLFLAEFAKQDCASVPNDNHVHTVVRKRAHWTVGRACAGEDRRCKDTDGIAADTAVWRRVGGDMTKGESPRPDYPIPEAAMNRSCIFRWGMVPFGESPLQLDGVPVAQDRDDLATELVEQACGVTLARY
jgi:hypothetical protein